MSGDLWADIPASSRLKKPLDLPPPLSEPELLAEMAALGERNSTTYNFLGAGAYHHFIPSALRHLVGRAEFYTAYTPYQPEASQGTLQAIYEYQSMVCELTGLDVANASMYDGATALAEAAFMACRITGKKKIAVARTVNPHYRQVLQTYCNAADLELVELPYDQKTGATNHESRITNDLACFILQQPNFFGHIEAVSPLAKKTHEAGAIFIVAANPISLGLLQPPGAAGADLVVGEGQPLGSPVSFGGPGLGILATKNKYLRQMPGRIVGGTVDVDGKKAFVLTMATREQHIRRERATSNICSNEALCALTATVYLSLLGKSGLKKVAELCLQKANYVRRALPAAKLPFPGTPIFQEFVVRTARPFGLALDEYYPELKGCRLLCVNETVKKEALDKLISELAAA
ncbi:MAG: aminomethyl-transferring glycine dehydrogenase subunit GcvPA [Candidatus Margulisiibacteriota bacterium]